jgi:sarcosine oxidase subunit alpha
MSSDQGKTSNVNALALLSAATGRTIPETGTTTFRAPYTPVSYGVLAGRDLGDFLEPVRVTPIHPWHEAKGAVFENVGQWKRPWFYPAMPGESMHQAVQREARAVRTSLGVLDASTLGKIDVQGRDAARFLDRIYTNTFSSLGIGRARYGLMCREDGMVFDDGVTTRLGEQHFWMTTTTGGAARVLDWLEEWLQTEWTDLEVYCTSITEQWATVAVAGPKARELLARVAPGMALDEEAFPFLSMREGRVAGLDACVFRISFTGELSYEINVPSCQGLALWEAVVQAGQEFGMTPYGTETMHLARAEKGFIIVGQETDGTVTPHDLGLGRMVAKGKDFLGKRSLERSDTRREDRKQLVGLLPAEPNEVLPEGAQITLEELPLPERHGGAPVPMVGHVTSSYFSPNLGRSFALALVKAGRSRLGTDIHVPLEGRAARARIVEPVFLHAS